MPKMGVDVAKLDQYKKYPSHTVRAIELLWKEVPELRFGQLIANVIKDDTDLYYIENAELIDRMQKFVKDFVKDYSD